MPSPPAPEVPHAGIDPVGVDKRSEPRHGCRRMVRVRRATPPGATFRLALVQNVSTQGIGLLLTEAVPPETVLEIEMHGQSIVKRFARVLHSTKQVGRLAGRLRAQEFAERRRTRRAAELNKTLVDPAACRRRAGIPAACLGTRECVHC